MFSILKRLTKKDWLMFAVSSILIGLTVMLELKLPDYMTQITQIIGQNGTIKQILNCGVKMLICALSSVSLSILVGFLAAKISANIGFELRKQVYGKVQDFSKEEINKFSIPSLITRSTNDVAQVQMFVSMAIQLAVKSPIMAVWAIIKILNKNWVWSLATLCGVIIVAIMLCLVIFIAIPKFKKIQILNDNLNRVSRENLTGVRVIRAFNAETYQEEKFDKANNDLTNNQLFTNKIMSLINPTMNFVMSALPLSIYIIGAFLIKQAGLFSLKLDLFSNMVVFSSYAIQVVMSFVMLVFIFMMLPRFAVSANRLSEVLETESQLVDGKGDNNTSEKGTIEFKNVGFKYPDAEDYILKDISFKVEKGQSVAFIGSTGSGKSTLINLIPRIYDVTEGVVLVDGVDVKEYKQEQLNDKIGYISQTPIIFNGTIKENVTLGLSSGEKPDDENVNRALHIAQAEYVQQMKDGLNTEIYQGGKNLSGGQKQRLSIARAIARNAEILIFDDSFSALDYKTDQELRNAIKNELVGVTTLIVAQRIGTIKDADRIIVLCDGRIVGDGKHKDLMQNCSLYKEIALSQLSKEEL